jgi:hypothetical protein
MKNYQQMFFGADSNGMILTGYTWQNSIEECKNVMSSFANPIGPTMYYILLNKFNVNQMVLSATGIFAPGSDGVMPPNPSMYTQDQETAASFNSEQNDFSSDQSDPASVKAKETAAKIITETGKTTVGTLTVNVMQILGFAIITLSQSASGTFRSVATELLRIQNALIAGTITDAEALAKYEFIVGRNPQIFGI